MTIAVALPQAEKGSDATSPMLPLPGFPAATTRAVESLNATGTNFSSLVPNTANWSMLFEVTMDQINAVDNYPNLINMSDGQSNINQTRLGLRPNSRNIALITTTSGIQVGPTIIGAYTDGVRFRVAVSRTGDRLTASLNNAAVVSHTHPNSPPAVNQLSIADFVNMGFSVLHRAELKQYSLTDAQLQAWV